MLTMTIAPDNSQTAVKFNEIQACYLDPRIVISNAGRKN